MQAALLRLRATHAQLQFMYVLELNKSKAVEDEQREALDKGLPWNERLTTNLYTQQVKLLVDAEFRTIVFLISASSTKNRHSSAQQLVLVIIYSSEVFE